LGIFCKGSHIPTPFVCINIFNANAASISVFLSFSWLQKGNMNQKLVTDLSLSLQPQIIKTTFIYA